MADKEQKKTDAKGKDTKKDKKNAKAKEQELVFEFCKLICKYNQTLM